MIRLSKCSLGEAEKLAVVAVLEREYLGMGADVVEFETSIKSYLETMSNVVCLNSGTAALQVAIEALDIGPGDSILVPSLTYVGTFQAVAATGALPIPCDVNPETLFIDVNDAKRRVREDTKAVIPVHYASRAVGMSNLRTFAKDFGLRVIEDAAQAFGCVDEFGKIGASGDIVCFSFDGIKNITAGEGGCIVTSDNCVLNSARDIRLLGVQKDTEKRAIGERSWDFEVERQGYRYHMSNINAAIGLAQLTRIQEFSEKRKLIANEYLKSLHSINDVLLPFREFDKIVPHLFVIRARDRDRLKLHLAQKGIETGIHYKPNHLLKRFNLGYSLPKTEQLYNELLSLPCHVDLTNEEIRYIADNIRNFYA